ncbi:hypothetical protein, partial [Herminiimonas fonticola]|uniref:hypothetical protein n=1 Tax=Herminiimonas fonticola TaxID=303380 RepID=UPI003340D88A
MQVMLPGQMVKAGAKSVCFDIFGSNLQFAVHRHAINCATVVWRQAGCGTQTQTVACLQQENGNHYFGIFIFNVAGNA